MVIIATVFFFLLILFPLRLNIKYCKNEHEDLLVIMIYFFQVIRGVKLKLDPKSLGWKWLAWYFLRPVAQPSSQNKAAGKRFSQKQGLRIRNWTQVYFALRRIMKTNRRFYKQISCHQLKWITELGLNDPAATAQAYGALWALKSQLFNNLVRNVRVDFVKPELEVRPDFNRERLAVDFQCQFSFRLFHLCSLLIKMAGTAVRLWVKKS